MTEQSAELLPLHVHFEHAVRLAPERIAVRFAGVDWTYRELDVRTNQLARYLRRLGVGPDVVVAVRMDRSFEMVVALLGILKAGGAYLPIDPGHPEERVRFVLRDSDAAVLLTQRRCERELSDFEGTRIELDGEWRHLQREDSTPIQSVNQPEDLAYVIYTSGSTGEPNGCMISHRAIVNRVSWMQNAYRLEANDCVLQKTPFTFDVSVWEFFWPLLAGARLVVATPGAHRDPSALHDTIEREAITVCHFVPSMLRAFLEVTRSGSCRSLRHVFASGEALPADVIDGFLHTLPAKLHNLYGPTEAAVDVTFWECERRADGKVPIGHPIENVRVDVRDAQHRPLAANEIGEIYIGGVAVARGYLNRPALTAARFVDDPDVPGAKMFRTGDRGRCLEDGKLEFLGRLDDQVKLRGLRLELGEVESALRLHPAIRDCAAAVRDETSGDPKLVAYLVTDQMLDAGALRWFLEQRLPSASIPNVFTAVRALPISAHGKLDRNALPWPLPRGPMASTTTDAADALAIQEVIQVASERLAALLHTDPRDVSPTADLFSVGATSLTLVHVIASLRERFGVAVPVDVILDTPTLAAMADYVVSRGVSTGARAPAPSLLPSETPRTYTLPPIDRTQSQPTFIRRTLMDRAVALADLAALLGLLAPDRDDDGVRFLHPSAGDLHAVSTYVYVKPRRVADAIFDSSGGEMDGGIYAFDRDELSLVPIDLSPAFTLRDAIGDRDAFDRASFVLFFVGQLDSLRSTYGASSMSLLSVEAGYMTQLLESRCASSSIALASGVSFDVDRVRAALRLQPSERVLRCIVGGAGGEEKEPRGRPQAPSPIAFRTIEIEPGDDASDPTETLSELIPGLHDFPAQPLAGARRHGRLGSHPIRLPRRTPPTRDYRARASCRAYDDMPVTQECLGALLGITTGSLHHTRIFLAIKARRVDGLDQGLYAYQPARHTLEHVAELTPDELEKSYTPFNRPAFRSAAFCIFMVANRNDRGAGRIEAGQIGQLMMESQARLALGMCPVGALRFDRLRSLFGVTADTELVHGLTAGPLVRSFDDESRGALAIIGLSGRYPGCESLDGFHRIFEEGTRTARGLPAERRELFKSTTPLDPTGMIAAYLDDIDCFDHALFGISPAAARRIDPQERICSELAWECLESAGYTGAGLRRTAPTIGVFAAAMWSDYHDAGVDVLRDGRVAEALSGPASISSRISHFWNFDGPSVTFNTACSSGLTALHFACESIERGDCDAAMVCATNLVAHPYHQRMLEAMAFLAPAGKASPFGADASGWLLGEGGGALLVKRLADAERDGDAVIAIVRGTSIAHGGQTAQLGVPSSRAWANSMRQALWCADLDASAIDYVEAAAPGAALADAAEAAALHEVFGSSRASADRCWVGSSKANIGHLESASAIAQITKVVLQMERERLTPAIGATPSSPLVDFRDTRLEIVTAPRAWPEPKGRPRRALVNAFAASGACGHAVLEQYAPAERRNGSGLQTEHLFPLSAPSAEQLRASAGRLRDALQAGLVRGVALADVAFTLQTGRVEMEERMCIVASTVGELGELLSAYVAGTPVRDARLFQNRATPDAVRQAPGDHDLRALAASWCRGERVTWAALHQGSERRVRLPGYTFRKTRHWLSGPSAREPRTTLPSTAGLERVVRECIAAIVEVSASDLASDRALSELGLTSVGATQLRADLETRLDIALPATLVFEHPTVAALVSFLRRELDGTTAPSLDLHDVFSRIPVERLRDSGLLGRLLDLARSADAPSAEPSSQASVARRRSIDEMALEELMQLALHDHSADPQESG